MTSIRPYLLRALIDWIVDNEDTPYMVLDCGMPGVIAPLDRVRDGRLVLNVSARATRNLHVGIERVDVDCRFGGRPMHISAPVGAVVAIYAQGSGMGMAFEPERHGADDESKSGNAADLEATTAPGADAVVQPGPRKPKPGAPKLTLVK